MLLDGLSPLVDEAAASTFGAVSSGGMTTALGAGEMRCCGCCNGEAAATATAVVRCGVVAVVVDDAADVDDAVVRVESARVLVAVRVLEEERCCCGFV